MVFTSLLRKWKHFVLTLFSYLFYGRANPYYVSSFRGITFFIQSFERLNAAALNLGVAFTLASFNVYFIHQFWGVAVTNT